MIHSKFQTGKTFDNCFNNEPKMNIVFLIWMERH